jgi:membrane-associated phospholipid phosphatase
MPHPKSFFQEDVMEWLWEVGVNLVIAVQSLGDWLAAPMRFFSFLGDEEFFLLILPALYWSVDAGLGLRVGVVLLLSGAVNDALKLSMYGPRPYWYSLDVRAWTAETSFGVPSGHAQIATSVWGMLAAYINRRWVWGVVVFIIFMIGISRLYMGVHFPHDVLLGWLVGALVLWGLLDAWQPVSVWVKEFSLWRQVALAFGFSMLLVLASTIPFLAAQNWEMPAAWMNNVVAAGIEELPHPITLNGIMTISGTLFGLFAGLAWMNTRGGFSAEGTVSRRILRYALGILGIGIIWFGLGAVFPRGEEILAYILRFGRYALVGAWVSAGAPWLFIKLKLARGLQI